MRRKAAKSPSKAAAPNYEIRLVDSLPEVAQLGVRLGQLQETIAKLTKEQADALAIATQKAAALNEAKFLQQELRLRIETAAQS